MSKQPLEEIIFDKILENNNVAIVGAASEGKSFFVVNKLIPFLENEGLTVQYVAESEAPIKVNKKANVIVFDEVETFLDKDFLMARYPEDKPYYYDNYIKRYLDFYKAINNLEIPAIFIITRNEKAEIKYLTQNFDSLDNGLRVEFLGFKK